MRLRDTKQAVNATFQDFVQFVVRNLGAVLAPDEASASDYQDNVDYITETFNEYLKPDDSASTDCSSVTQQVSQRSLIFWANAIKKATMSEYTCSQIERFTNDIRELILPKYLPPETRDVAIKQYVVKPEQCEYVKIKTTSLVSTSPAAMSYLRDQKAVPEVSDLNLKEMLERQRPDFNSFIIFIAGNLNGIVSGTHSSDNANYIAETFYVLFPESEYEYDTNLQLWCNVIKTAQMSESTMDLIENFTRHVFRCLYDYKNQQCFLNHSNSANSSRSAAASVGEEKYVVTKEQCKRVKPVANAHVSCSFFSSASSNLLPQSEMKMLSEHMKAINELCEKIHDKLIAHYNSPVFWGSNSGKERNKVLSISEEAFYKVLLQELKRIYILLDTVYEDGLWNNPEIICLFGYALSNAAKATAKAEAEKHIRDSLFSLPQSVQLDFPIVRAYRLLRESEQICNDFFSAAGVNQTEFKLLYCSAQQDADFAAASDLFMPIPRAVSSVAAEMKSMSSVNVTNI